MIDADPSQLYPNSVAEAFVGRLRAEMSSDVDVYQFAADIFDGAGADLRVHPSAYETTGIFVNSLGPAPQDEIFPGLVEHRWRGRVRVSHHNPRNELEKHQEALVYVERVVAAVQGWKVPVTGVDGVSGGERLVKTGDREQVINNPNFAVYRIPVDAIVQHEL